jgi:hypothetical protein
MVDKSANINKPKESLNSDGQQFYQYQQKKLFTYICAHLVNFMGVNGYVYSAQV